MQTSGSSRDDSRRPARRFAPAPWAWAAAGLVIALCSGLGSWQVHRGVQKQQLLDSLADPAPVRLELAEGLAAPARMTAQRAYARGAYDPARTLLLEQAHEGVPGYLVWTPLRLAGGASVMVDRGWIPRGQAGIEDPPAGPQAVPGLWRALPEPGLRLAGSDNCPAAPRFPLPVLYPTVADLECLVGSRVLPGLLVLDAGQPGVFTPSAPLPGLPPERHYGYALQWFALALTAAVLFVVLGWRRA